MFLAITEELCPFGYQHEHLSVHMIHTYLQTAYNTLRVTLSQSDTIERGSGGGVSKSPNFVPFVRLHTCGQVLLHTSGHRYLVSKGLVTWKKYKMKWKQAGEILGCNIFWKSVSGINCCCFSQTQLTLTKLFANFFIYRQIEVPSLFYLSYFKAHLIKPHVNGFFLISF